jgi:hypothetical protein
MVWFGKKRLAVVISVLSALAWVVGRRSFRPPLLTRMAARLGHNRQVNVFLPRDVRGLDFQRTT